MELTSKRTPTPDLRGFLSSRRGATILALLCAAAAGVVLFVAIRQYRSSVHASQQSVTVLVANRLIQKGTSGTAIATGGEFTAESLGQKQVTAGAVADIASIGGRVAVRDILPGSQLTAADFAAASGLAAQLAPTKRGVALTLDPQHGLIGVVHTGDHVDIYGGFSVDQGSGPPRPILRLLDSNILVLQASSTSSGIGANQAPPVVVDVASTQVGALLYAQQNGQVWMVLRGNGATNTPQTFNDLGSELLGLTPIQNAAFNQAVVNALAARAGAR